MTLIEIIDELKKIALLKPNINFTADGDIYMLNSLPSINYSVFFITQNNHNADEDIINYNLNLFYINRLAENNDNQLYTQSTGIIMLINILNEFNKKFDDVEIKYPLNFQVFNQKFSDECAGVWCTVTIQAENNIGLCSE